MTEYEYYEEYINDPYKGNYDIFMYLDQSMSEIGIFFLDLKDMEINPIYLYSTTIYLYLMDQAMQNKIYEHLKYNMSNGIYENNIDNTKIIFDYDTDIGKNYISIINEKFINKNNVYYFENADIFEIPDHIFIKYNKRLKLFNEASKKIRKMENEIKKLKDEFNINDNKKEDDHKVKNIEENKDIKNENNNNNIEKENEEENNEENEEENNEENGKENEEENNEEKNEEETIYELKYNMTVALIKDTMNIIKKESEKLKNIESHIEKYKY